tara:strand:- start:112 stop:504 length:393 start_codon:yes stop_codon:yes gene_type:complete
MMPEKVTKEERLAEQIMDVVSKAREMLQEPTNEQLPLPSNEEEVERKDPKPMADETENLNQKEEGFGLGGEEVGSPVKKEEEQTPREIMIAISKLRDAERKRIMEKLYELGNKMGLYPQLARLKAKQQNK